MTKSKVRKNMDLGGARVVITGAGGGIGSALARALHGEGATLFLTSRSSQKLSALSSEIGLNACRAVAGDLTDELETRAVFDRVRSELGSITALVNVAGLSIPGELAEASIEDYQAVWNANVTSTFLASKHALPLLVDDGTAQVINVSSVAGLRPNAAAPMYTTAKAGVEMLTRSLAMQVRERGIRVTAVSPGGTDTDFWGDRPVNRAALLSTQDVVDSLMFVLTRPMYVQVTSLVLEPFHP